MDSIVEQQRQCHEDIERLELAVVDLMLQNLNKHRYRLIREHKISELLEQIQDRSKLLTDLENDASGLRASEATAMADRNFDEFYDRLGKISSYHRRNPDLAVYPPELEYVKYKNNPEEVDEQNRDNDSDDQIGELGKESVETRAHNRHVVETFMNDKDRGRMETMFSGEERLGRYVDLHEQYELYLNIKDAQRLAYLDYLTKFTEFASHPKKSKNSKYAEYLCSLQEYFENFFARAMPLFDLPHARDQARDEFSEVWRKREVPGWETTVADDGGAGELFCPACKKRFEKDTTFKAHMNSRKHLRTVKRLESANNGSDSKDTKAAIDRNAEQWAQREHDLAWSEFLVRKYSEVLADRISETRADVQRRQALTEEERNQELEEDDPVLAEEDDDQDEQTYNPLNLPMGWDGKPIPFWLYKLHGLGVKFTCEICGNAIYRGRKAYEKHFQEARHATNMRRLGIPNTRQFHGVAAIDEAQTLWERIQKEKKNETANNDTFEEYEDSEGNVFNKKTFLDLKRQGLI
ncbi:Pre-mRNA-splicing factor sap61 [Coemansia sp. RSA 988]|nr:Pre-mRNA-splicing factor sap61 [Coemansia sp. RSA 988]